MISRRTLLGAGMAMAVAAKKPSGLRIGATDWNLRLGGKPEALALAKSLGFEGVELSLLRQAGGDKLVLEDAGLLAGYLAEAARQEMAVAGTCLHLLNSTCVNQVQLAQNWLDAGIGITARLKARVMLVPFFGKCKLMDQAQIDALVGVLKEHAPSAEKAGMRLGLENTLSAEDNARILERVGSKAVRVYYDVGNSTSAGFDPVKELRWLGGERICQIHLKDKGYMGQGAINFPEVMKAIADIGFRGFATFETGSPSGSVPDDMRKNLAYIRGLMG